jgi:hypothetical protein
VTSTLTLQNFSSRHAPQLTLIASPRLLRCSSPCIRPALTFDPPIRSYSVALPDDVTPSGSRSGSAAAVSTNGCRLWRRDLLEQFTTLPPYRLVVSLYRASEAAYDGLTQRRGSYKVFRRGIAAAVEARLPVRLNIVVTDVSAADASARAGHTFFHADPHGRVSICKVGRDDQIDLMCEGLDGLRRLGGIADRLITLTGQPRTGPGASRVRARLLWGCVSIVPPCRSGGTGCNR